MTLLTFAQPFTPECVWMFPPATQPDAHVKQNQNPTHITQYACDFDQFIEADGN